MLNTIIIIFSFYALTHAIKESWLFDKPRIFLIRISPFFYHLFECYLCLGFWVGLIVYLVATPFHQLNFRNLFLWGLASSGISFLLNAVANRLLKD